MVFDRGQRAPGLGQRAREPLVVESFPVLENDDDSGALLPW